MTPAPTDAPTTSPAGPLTIRQVLVSGAGDRYADMACVSAAAARLACPNARITLHVDGATADTLTRRPDVTESFDEIVATPVDLPTPKERSRFIKTSLRATTTGAFLYLDLDALMMAPIADLVGDDIEMGAVLDRMPGNPTPVYPGFAREYYRTMDWPVDLAGYYNSGVVWWSDAPAARRAGELYHEHWRRIHRDFGQPLDQPAFNSAVRASGVSLRGMPVAFNAMIDASPRFARRARIFHYYTVVRDGVPGQTKPGTLLEHLIDHLRDTGRIDHAALRRAARKCDPWVNSDGGFTRQWATGHPLRAFRLGARNLPGRVRRWLSPG